MSGSAARKVIALGRYLATLPGLCSLGLVIISGLGLACRLSGGAFILDWWLLVLGLVLTAWVMLAVLPGQTQMGVPIRARQLALIASPLGLLLLWMVCSSSSGMQRLLEAWALGGIVALLAAYTVLPHLVNLPGPFMLLLRWPGTVWVMALTWSCFIFMGTALQWWRFGQGSQDMAIYEQALYNTLHGSFLTYTIDLRFPDIEMCRFADHFEPIILAFVPLYALWGSPLWLLLAQAVVPATGAVAVARLTQRWCHSSTAGLILAGAYLLSPGLLLAVWHDFHPITLAAAPVLWGIYWGLQGYRWWCVLMLVLAMACKENVPGTVAMVGFYLFWRGERRLGLGISLLAVAWGLLAILFIIPHFSPTGNTFYANLLTFTPHVLSSIPGYERAYVIQRIDYLATMLGATGGVSILSPVAMAISAPELCMNLFSRNPWMHTLYAHYHVLVGTGFMVSTAAGLAWLRTRFTCIGKRAILFGFGVAVLWFLQGETAFRVVKWTDWITVRTPAQHELARLLTQVPDDIPILTNDPGLISHLARRRHLIFRYAPGKVTVDVLRGYQHVAIVALSSDQDETGIKSLTRTSGFKLLGKAGKYTLWQTQSVVTH